MSWLSNLFGGSGGGGGSSSIWGDIFKSILGGVGSSADAKLGVEMAEKKARIEGTEDRKTLDFTSQLNDYNAQLGKQRKRTALDTYGQFDLTKRWAPTANITTPPVQVPTRPTPQ